MRRNLKSFDFLLLFLVCAVSIFGIVLINSAAYNSAVLGISNFSYSQLIWFISGLILLLLAAFIDYHFICKFYIIFYIINTSLLVAVIILSNSSVARWLSFGEVGIQPSEFSKIFTIIFLAKIIDKYQKSINNIAVLSCILASTIITFILVNKQPSLSASLVILAILTAILFVSKINYKYVLVMFGLGVPIIVAICQDAVRTPHIFVDKILTSYQIGRITSWLNPNESDPLYYQTLHSIRAIGSGQLAGKGLNSGTLTQINYVPYAHNDFIFSVLGEEFGFIGCVSLLVVMLFIVCKCLFIAHNSVDLIGRIIASGVGAMIAFQTFVNVGVATGLLTNTGMPFPFVSYGGSSMWVCMIGIGLVINVSMSRHRSVFRNGREDEKN